MVNTHCLHSSRIDEVMMEFVDVIENLDCKKYYKSDRGETYEQYI